MYHVRTWHATNHCILLYFALWKSGLTSSWNVAWRIWNTHDRCAGCHGRRGKSAINRFYSGRSWWFWELICLRCGFDWVCRYDGVRWYVGLLASGWPLCFYSRVARGLPARRSSEVWTVLRIPCRCLRFQFLIKTDLIK